MGDAVGCTMPFLQNIVRHISSPCSSRMSVQGAVVQETDVPTWMMKAKEDASLDAMRTETRIRKAVLEHAVTHLEEAYTADISYTADWLLTFRRWERWVAPGPERSVAPWLSCTEKSLQEVAIFSSRQSKPCKVKLV
jgi:hypothetical protein